MRIFRKIGRSRIGIGVLGIMASGCASLSGSHAGDNAESLPLSSPMEIAGTAKPPSGLVDLCKRQPDMCQAQDHSSATETLSSDQTEILSSYQVDLSSDQVKRASRAYLRIRPARLNGRPLSVRKEGATLSLTQSRFALLQAINREVNNSITPADDRSLFGRRDYWSPPLTTGKTRFGDCEEYALEKRAQLIVAGIDPAFLYLSVVTSDRSGRHLVLVVATDRGDYVLDNLRSRIVGWRRSGYDWISRQSDEDLLSWSHVALAPASEPQRMADQQKTYPVKPARQSSTASEPQWMDDQQETYAVEPTRLSSAVSEPQWMTDPVDDRS